MSLLIKETFNKCKVLGTGSGKVVLSAGELGALLKMSLAQLGFGTSFPAFADIDLPSLDYYEIPLGFFEDCRDCKCSGAELLKIFDAAFKESEDFLLYFRNICSLHQRRRKYQWILSSQPRPTVEQVGHRSLLEYGLCDISLLKNWMIWRKWVFDIDNRSGQETGYLFEPILASCLGGQPVGSKASPIGRLNAEGKEAKGARQIDCLLADEEIVYEFKIRVSIAASGQGRFAEELSWPVEAKSAGYHPILLVLDPTPSNRLTELTQAFQSTGGEVYTGEEAWKHIDERSGPVMSQFVERYIRPPIEAVDDMRDGDLIPIELTWDATEIQIRSGSTCYRLERTGNVVCEDEEGD